MLSAVPETPYLARIPQNVADLDPECLKEYAPRKDNNNNDANKLSCILSRNLSWLGFGVKNTAGAWGGPVEDFFAKFLPLLSIGSYLSH
jgi:hypothetical protein